MSKDPSLTQTDKSLHEPIFIFICYDKPGGAHLRQQVRSTHLEYMIAVLNITVFGGPIRDAADTLSLGSVFALRLPDRAAAEAFLREEPYNKAGLFESVRIELWRPMAPEAYGGALQDELERERINSVTRRP